MTVVLAICEGVEGGERMLGIVVPLAGLVGWVVIMRALWKSTAHEERPFLTFVFLFSGIAVPLFWLLPGISDPDYDYLGMFVLFVSLVVGASALLSIPRQTTPGKAIVTSLLGAVLVPGLLVGLFVFSLAASGGCIG